MQVTKIVQRMKITTVLSSIALCVNLVCILLVYRKDIPPWLVYVLIVSALFIGLISVVMDFTFTRARRRGLVQRRDQQRILRDRNERILALWDEFEALAQESCPAAYAKNQTTAFRLLRKEYDLILSKDDIDCMYDLLHYRLNIISEGKSGYSPKEEKEIVSKSEMLLGKMREKNLVYLERAS